MRDWLVWRGETAGLLIAAVMACILGLLILPYGRSENLVGRVAAFGVSESRTGTHPLAVIDLPRGRVTVRLPKGHLCTLGGAIIVRRTPRLWGASFHGTPRPCPGEAGRP